MVTSLSTIKNWFKTGLKPTQAQFWATWDSFFHKGEKIPVSSVKDLDTYLNEKAEKEAFTLHLTDEEAHSDLFDNKVDKVDGYGLSEENFTLPEKEKISKIYPWHYALPINDLQELATILEADCVTMQRRYVHSEGVDYFYNGQAEEGDLAPDDQTNGTGFWIKANPKKLDKGTYTGTAEMLKNEIELLKLAQIVITTDVDIDTDTTDADGTDQKGRNVIIDNGANVIGFTVKAGADFTASYLKHGTGNITFLQATGRTLVQVNGTNVLNGAKGSTATISSIGTTDYLKINNV